MKDQDYVVYSAVFADEAAAIDALGRLRALDDLGDLRKLSASLVTRDRNGRLHVSGTTDETRKAGNIGLVAGLVLGAVFPPAGLAILSSAIAGGVSLGVIGSAIGHFAGGLPRKDMREIGALLDDGEAAIVAIAVDAVASDVDAALSKAARKASKHLSKGAVGPALEDLDKGMRAAASAIAEAR